VIDALHHHVLRHCTPQRSGECGEKQHRGSGVHFLSELERLGGAFPLAMPEMLPLLELCDNEVEVSLRGKVGERDTVSPRDS